MSTSLLDRDASEIYVYTDNTIGTLTGLSDADGNLVEYYQYSQTGRPAIFDANNVPLAASLVGNPFFQHGRRWDAEQGCYYYRNRFYSPDLGRFIHRDPTGQADGPNQYQFCNNNPLNCSDPSGNYITLPGLDELKSIFDSLVDGIWEGAKELVTSYYETLKTIISNIIHPFVFLREQWNAVLKVADTFANLFLVADRLSVFNALELYDKLVASLFLQITSERKFLFDPVAHSIGKFLCGVLVGGAILKLTKWIKGKWAKYNRKHTKPDYSSIENPPNVGPGQDFSKKQKQEAIDLNKAHNGGTVMSDLDKTPLKKPKKSKRGVTPDPEEWQVDHIIPKSKGGTNESSNMQILSRRQNRDKSNS